MRTEQDIFDDLAALCSSPGYAHAIAYLCFRDNWVRYTGEMTVEDMSHLFSMTRLIRTEISTLVGLLIKGKVDYSLPTQAILKKYLDDTETLLEEMHLSMSAVMFAGLDPKKVVQGDFSPFTSGDALREPIFYGGESAYSFQYRDLSPRKYANDDEWLKVNKGFSIQTARDVVHAVGKAQDKKMTVTMHSLREVLPEERTVLPGYTLTVQEIAEYSVHELSVVRSVLTAFALSEVEKNKKFCALHDFNVANASPLLPISDDTFILFQIYSLAEALYEAPFYWMGSDKTYVDVAMRHRGAFTEDFSRERLDLVFGKDNVHSNVDIFGSKRNKIGEIDVLVIYGNRVIVLQAKSKRLTLEARRGNDGRIRDDFKKSIQDSYDQGFACAKLLTDAEHKFMCRDLREIVIPPNIKEVYIICVVSDHYPALSFQARQFLKYETTTTIQPPFIMDVFTLDAMTEMLESPLRLLSYLNLRTKYSDKLLASHELTILSYHLKQNLWLDDEHDIIMMHDDITVDLDVAMTVRRDGIPGTRTPDGILTRFAATALGPILKEIEARQDPATIELGFMLLTLSEETVVNVSKGIEKITNQTKSDRKHHDFTVGIGAGSTGLTIHCNNDPISISGPRLQSHCRGRKYAQHADRWFGVCISPENALPRFGLSLDHTWMWSAEMDDATQRYTMSNSLVKPMSPAVTKRKIGRNELCTCGSGLKYKRCCGA